ncbi:thiosulfate dehydrogenase [quinone] large subunit [Winogradskyella pacifica]|uniref:Thiosulfate dehydrogenase [quinone] large subunit n=1 Tax=Winogradskyella pacifica TaxID=664642 RepID=A0A3D9LLH9_9FLAO|nr:TQO small subunit DoxD [Winogradskyella pacifica]REE08259.1 thiosulfate dehydrogenase [quinone] large subunit [Winogradskyella pacifica]
MNLHIKNDSGFLALAVRMVIGWTYFSAFFRRTILANKLDPELPGYIGEKFNHFLPNALGIKPIIQYLVENPDILYYNMVAFTIIEGIVGLFIIFGLFTRLMSIGVFGLAMGILLGSGWIGTTCLDEWQIGILGIATGFLLFLTGSGRVSLDNYLMNRNVAFTKKKWFAWLGSGQIPIKDIIFTRFVIVGSFLIFGLTLYTNQVFHGGLWGTLHNKSVKPKLEITEGKLNENGLSFDVFRVEGVDVYGAWIIGIELKDDQDNVVMNYTQDQLAKLPEDAIENYYIAKVKPGKHSLIAPLGAKAKMKFNSSDILKLPSGTYTLKMTDISGASWEHQIIK